MNSLQLANNRWEIVIVKGVSQLLIEANTITASTNNLFAEQSTIIVHTSKK